METTTLPTLPSTVRPWSVPAASMPGLSAGIGGTTAPNAGLYGTAPSVKPAAAAKHVAASFGAGARGAGQAFIPAAGRQADADARTVTTLDPGSPPRDRRLL